MKKVVLAIGAGLFPWFFLASAYLDSELHPGQPGEPLLFSLGVWVLGLICALLFLALARHEGWGARETAKIALVVKLIHIPYYALMFVMAALLIAFPMMAVMAWLMDVLTIVLSGFVGLSAVLRCRTEGSLTRTQTVVHGILQFIFCADVISAIIVYRKSKEGSL